MTTATPQTPAGLLSPEIGADVLRACIDHYSPLHSDTVKSGKLRDLRYGAHERHACDVFRPRQGDGGTRPILVFVHGGGFVRGGKTLPGTPFYDNIGHWAARHGFVGVTMNYRLAPDFKWPAGGDDITALLAWLVANPAVHGADASRIWLVGHSAGAAHVATCVARLQGTLRGCVAGAVLASGMYNPAAAPASVSHAYFGADEAQYPDKASAPRLPDAGIPLLFTINEFEPVMFKDQARGALNAFPAGPGRPELVQLDGHNHYTCVLNIGLPGHDLLGEQILKFVSRGGPNA